MWTLSGRQSSPYQSRDSKVSGVHLLGQPVNFSPGVEEDHSLGDCQSFIQITQGVQLPLLSTIKRTSQTMSVMPAKQKSHSKYAQKLLMNIYTTPR